MQYRLPLLPHTALQQSSSLDSVSRTYELTLTLQQLQRIWSTNEDRDMQTVLGIERQLRITGFFKTTFTSCPTANAGSSKYGGKSNTTILTEQAMKHKDEADQLLFLM